MLRMLMPVDSHANFVLTNVQHPVVEVIEHFRKHNILIGRHFPPLDNYMRVSLGTPADMKAFWQVVGHAALGEKIHASLVWALFASFAV